MNFNNAILNAYENQVCPDCQEGIPHNVEGGDECENCGHVFYEIESEQNIE